MSNTAEFERMLTPFVRDAISRYREALRRYYAETLVEVIRPTPSMGDLVEGSGAHDRLYHRNVVAALLPR
jgi:hypothetical protein